jgi:hypothetical protein
MLEFGYFDVSTLVLWSELEIVGVVEFRRLVHTIGSWRPSRHVGGLPVWVWLLVC